MAEETPICDFGWKAPPFTLPAIDGKTYSLEALRGQERHAGDVHLQPLSLRQGGDRPHRARCEELRGLGIGAVAISSNDAVHYPEDSFDNMRRFAEAHRFSFPYLYDESQDVARAYDAACTPDFFGFNADLELQYRGRLDASRKEAAPATVRRDLFEAMRQIATTGQGPREQIPSIGCSIKWKAA